MNKLDSETVTALLEREGFSVVSDINKADVILLNTCSVREKAENRIHGRIAELSSLRKYRPGLFFGVIGCMAQRLENRLISDFVRIVAGPDSYRKLPDMIRQAVDVPVVETVLKTDETYCDIAPVRSSPYSAWIAVMRGCNNFCSYCIVPYLRGRERSIHHKFIIEHIKKLKKDGCLEVTLLGQNVNSYYDSEVDFAGLLEQSADTGIEWIRFLTSHPKNLNEDILNVIARCDNVCNHLHLPLQSGSDRILSRMNRGYTISDYMTIVRNAKSLIKGLSITTDMIFGFPGETEEDFQATLSIMKEIKFDYAFLYRYSERELTQASSMNGSVPEHVRIERLKEAIELQQSITRRNNLELIGTEQVVMVKDVSKDSKGWYGFSETALPVVLTTDTNNIEIGSFVKVKIESTTGASLVGKAV